MTIKTKLITNLLLTSAIVLLICLGGYSSLRFIQEKFLYSAEISTPYQMRTVEFERELQICITSLLKVNTSRTAEEYAEFKVEAEKSLAKLLSAQDALNALKSVTERLKVATEFGQIAEQIIAVSAVRIDSEHRATSAHKNVTKLLLESSTKLKELENRIKHLQAARATAFAATLKNTTQWSLDLRRAENLRNLVKELQSAAIVLVGTTDKTSFLIARGRINTLLGRLGKNKHTGFFAMDLQTLSDYSRQLVELQADFVARNDRDSKQRVLASLKEHAEMSNFLHLSLNQEIELLTARVDSETKHQGILFSESNRANEILLANSELVGLGLTVTAQVNQLFSEKTIDGLETDNAQLLNLFTTIHVRAENLEQALVTLGAKDDLQTLHQAHTSLEALRRELFSNSGIIATLKNRLKSIDDANNSTNKLHSIAIAQSVLGKETTTTARVEQEQAIVAVNDIIRTTLSRIATSGGIAVTIGVLFGFWILHSVLGPLRFIHSAIAAQMERGKEKAALAEAVARGDLDRKVEIGTALDSKSLRIKNDEFGAVLQDLVGMSQSQITLDHAFADMTASLRTAREDNFRRDRIKNGLFELNKILRSEGSISKMAESALSFLANYLDAGVGILYRFNSSESMLYPVATFACNKSERLLAGVQLGEGLAGQVAVDKRALTLNSVPSGYLTISSALGKAEPLTMTIMPIIYIDMLVGVVELGSFKPFSNDDTDFLQQALEGIAIAISVNSSREHINKLLEQTMSQAEELRVQQEELQQSNEELLERATLKANAKGRPI